jgi:hypothetical protein
VQAILFEIAMKVFLYTWINFIWMFVALGPVIGPADRSLREWFIRGVIGGFAAGLLAFGINRWKDARALRQALHNEEL